MRIIASVMCGLMFGSKLRPGSPGRRRTRLSPEMGRAEPRRHRAGLQRYAPMQAKPSKMAGVPISETDDTRGSSDGTPPRGNAPQGGGPAKAATEAGSPLSGVNRRCSG